MQQPPPYMAAIQENYPKLAEYIDDGRGLILADGALSAKVKTLMTMLCDSLLTHHDGVEVISDRARSLGATEEEIAETIAVAFWMGGLPALVTGCNAWRE